MNRSKLRKLPENVILAFLAGFAVLLYIFASYFKYRIGFPLDDAWIHQTYARNIAQYSEFAFTPGEVSAGSTSPLWSGILAVGYLLGIYHLWWSFLVGWVLLLSLGYVGTITFRALCPSKSNWSIWAGVLIVLEWHLVWASVSGMETLLFTLLILMVITALVKGSTNWIVIGLMIGASIWIRPDGVTLLGPSIFTLVFIERTWRKRFYSISYLLIGFFLLFVPYLIFNLSLSGSIFPNTFYAKQAEYAVELREPVWVRVLEQAALLLVGVGVILLPGFMLNLSKAIKSRVWGSIAGAIWLIGYLLMYALRLPVTYQHGRYVIPAMPIYFLWSVAGLACWLEIRSTIQWKRIVGWVWLLSSGVVLIVFIFLGGRAYASDVALIESEMVNTAYWVEKNTESDALIAAHDIGALGFFGNRQIVDLAGLVSPDVVPFIRDESRLADYLNEMDVDYLVTFPGWYPTLVDNLFMIYKSSGKFSLALGGENMAVYIWEDEE